MKNLRSLLFGGLILLASCSSEKAPLKNEKTRNSSVKETYSEEDPLNNARLSDLYALMAPKLCAANDVFGSPLAHDHSKGEYLVRGPQGNYRIEKLSAHLTKLYNESKSYSERQKR